MSRKITVEDGHLVIRVPMKAERSNPYDDDFKEEMDAIVGVIAGSETSFSCWIDMAYKDKGDQISMPFYVDYMEKDEFRTLCKKAKCL